MNLKITKTTLSLGLMLLFLAQLSFAQVQTPFDQGLRFIEKEYANWGLDRTDIINLGVSSMYTNKRNGVTHIYFIQKHQGIEVYNAITSVHVTPEGKTFNVGNRFVPNLKAKINATSPSLSAQEALQAALGHLGLSTNQALRLNEQISDKEFVFDKGDFAHTDVNVKLKYQLTNDQTVRLAWHLAVDQLDRKDYWSVRIDAQTGELLDKNNWMVHCQFVDDPYHNHDRSCNAHLHNHGTKSVKKVLESEAAVLTGRYSVFGEMLEGVNSPHESPIHGDYNLLVNPHSPSASPFGWHDTNGADGAEFTITRGNNVHAYLDLNNTSTPTGEPDGGAELVFDFPYNPNNEPEDQRDAAVTNLFYMVNSIHDFSHHFGFDESAGAFQSDNYGSGGNDDDYVLAEAQDGNGDVNNLNNANFATPPDGGNGVMQMYLWNQGGGRLLNVDAPEALIGQYETGTADFGPEIGDVPVTGEVIVIEDNSSEASFGCNDIVTEDVAGKIAMVDRGGCFFEQKAANAEAAGAIALIICNFENSTVGMAGVAEINDPGIPTVSLSSGDCSLFRSVIDQGLTVTLVSPTASGPSLLDGDFDNGIIAHEFAHGISNRLTGGPLAAGCLGNGEQMGEGWSDIYTLMMTVKPGDTGEMRRGIGTYVQRQGTNGSGIRPLPYSTDFNINNHTYDDVIRFAGSVHSVGAVWTAMLWDMYWALVEEHGFDIDYTNPEAGNNIAVHLITEGMKLQPCSPGFVDGRDGILAADMMNYDGANQCLIWEVFAKRGLGFYADQGTSNSDADGTSSFEALPTCIKELKIAKTATDLIEPGDAIDYTITVTNHKDEAVTNVVVSDIIPNGCSYVAGSSEDDVTESNGMLTWEIGTLQAGAEIVLSYQAVSSANEGSIMLLEDDFEDPSTVQADWVSFSLDDALTNNWTYIDGNAADFVNSGERSYFVPDLAEASDQVLLLSQPYIVSGEQPVLRFFHKFDTQAGTDGGYLQVSNDGAESWEDIGPYIFKNPYRGQVSYQTFTIPFQEAYWGVSDGFVDTYVDLSDFAGETLFFRWRFGSDDDGTGGTGWALDDVTFMDMLNYNSEVCVSSEEGDSACAEAPNRGTIVGQLPTSIKDLADPSLGISVFPNPANDYLIVNLQSEFTERVNLSIASVDGRIVKELALNTNAGTQSETINTSDLSSGFYFVRVATPRGIQVQKIVIE